MRDVLSHRGPDGAGLHGDDRALLAHRRLSIVDLAGGHQPLSNEDGQIWVTYNGEIYNHADVRAALAACRRADCVVLLTDHSAFDYAAIARSARRIVDTRNAFRAYRMEKIVRL